MRFAASRAKVTTLIANRTEIVLILDCMTRPFDATPPRHTLRAGMLGLGMIFDETYRPFFEQMAHAGYPVGRAAAQAAPAR